MINIQTKPIDAVHQILIDSIIKFFKNANCTKAVLGLSGGIDSAVVCALAVEALGNENVHGILMPSPFSTLSSIADATKLSNNLMLKYDIIPIEKIYERIIKDINPIFGNDNHWDTTQENIQARIRGTILMAYSNRHNALLLNTSNKSEMSTGYGTLYGDLAGSLMVIADLYKIQVYELAEYINFETEKIPFASILKAPSAELRPNQKDSDALPEYNILDPILYQIIEKGKSVEELIKMGADQKIVEKIFRLRKASDFKKHQMAPLIQISEKPLLDKSKCI
ncbi:MAG: NAD(+) synthase [Bacteroidales bacterium]